MEKPDQTEPTQEPAPLIEGRDFYVEKGYFVFTEYFLLQRGKCCGSGCRHCPYRKKNQARTNHKK